MYDPLYDEIEIGRIYLETQKVSYRLMGGFMQANLRFTAERDALLGQMIYELATNVLTHKLPPETVEETGILACDHPATWWQQWKHDIATNTRGLRWIARRWPVHTIRTVHKLTVTLDLRRFRVYPDAPNISPVRGFGINFMNYTSFTTARWDTDDVGANDDTSEAQP